MNAKSDNSNLTEITTLQHICSMDFQINPEENPEHKNFKDVIVWLQKEIQYLLDNNFEKLLNIMYRIDIGEDRFREALSNQRSKDISYELAELVVERELQKVRSRKKYQSK